MKTAFETDLIVEDYLDGARIDRFLSRHFRNYSTHRLQRIVQAGFAKVNGIPADPLQRVFRGQQIDIRLPEPPDKTYDPEPLPLEVLYEDAWLIIVNKPPGMIAHPAGNILSGTVANALQYYLDQQTGVRSLLRPGIVHRLDQFTSGILIVAKEHLGHRSLSIQFQQNRVSKSYLAIVRDQPEQDLFENNDAIGEHPTQAGVCMTTHPEALRAKAAFTRFEVVERLPGHSLIRAFPKTGRLHQIRVHLADLGFPIIADDFYGNDARLLDDRELITRQALHAEQIEFSHPVTSLRMNISAGVPADFQLALQRIRSAWSV
ncbi:MAG: RNA pseudouridine synthase [Gimesia sp.]|uniref:Pseudouridine synthase n=1 Tax=Gimesia maris TaxID=122 RepID=A0A3D3R9R3_9PLAN|nr:RNA pseudouridine synthase [Gimesia sp.]HCO25565.1 RluA family pseudouridine synthase [Gimesia maris]|tara:strand:+ start:113632 stop:114585 length:954 start_codon:yes stop_codon:yes gene_type:complete